MKKALFMIIAICALQNVKAQNTTPPVPKTYRLGVMVSSGLGWAGSSDNALSSSSVRIPFSYGLMLDYSFARNYSLTFGLNDLYTGGRLIFNKPVLFKSFSDTFAAGAKTTYRIHYIEIPVLLKLKSNNINYKTYFVQLGLNPEIKVGATGDIQGNNLHGKTEDISNEQMGKDVALFGIGLVVGVGMEYQLTENNSLVFSLSYNNSFTDFKASESGALNNNSQAVLRRVALTAGIYF